MRRSLKNRRQRDGERKRENDEQLPEKRASACNTLFPSRLQPTNRSSSLPVRLFVLLASHALHNLLSLEGTIFNQGYR